ncbi:uncharacterized protein LOC100184585 [Ciona intestinalis]
MAVTRGCDHIWGYQNQSQGNIQCDVSNMVFYPNTKALTTCYYSCNNTDNCNNISTTKLKPCTKACSVGSSYCDYLTGKCVCRTPAYKFPNCTAAPSPTTYRSCVQCNGETDENCHNMTKSCQCSRPDTSQPFCSSTKTSTIAPVSHKMSMFLLIRNRTQSMFLDGNVIRNIVTRGCSSSFTSADECFFTKPSDSSLSTYTEYTCISTCDTNGCNTGTLDDKNKRLYCVQCDLQKRDDCKTMTTRTRCQSDMAKYCVSKVEYYIPENVDRNYKVEPEYMLVNISRGCATESVTKQCESTLVGSLSAMKVICQESCQMDGCNVGWPARPQCSICNSQSSSTSSTNPADTKDGYDSCIYNPPPPVQCKFPYQQYCVASLKTKNLPPAPNSGYAQEMVRSCSYHDYGNGCTDVGTVGGYGYSYYNCNRTCKTYGCNSGLISTSIRVTSSVYWHFFPAMVTIVSQQWTSFHFFRIHV